MEGQEQGYSSSGDSVVHLKGPYAVQTFRHPPVYTFVRRVAMELLTSSPVNHLFSDATRYTYSPIDFHSRAVNHSETESSVTWERIHCLNQMESHLRMRFIRTHYVKFLWDVLKGIFALSDCGFRHGDPSLDNIGVRQGRFVLFDYNLSRPVLPTQRSDGLRRDLYYFSRSLRWNCSEYDPDTPLDATEESLLELIPQIRHLEEFVEAILIHRDDSDYASTLHYLDALSLTDEPPTHARDDNGDAAPNP